MVSKIGNTKTVEVTLPSWMYTKWFLAIMIVMLIAGFIYMTPGLNTAVFGSIAKITQGASLSAGGASQGGGIKPLVIGTATPSPTMGQEPGSHQGVNQLKSVWATEELNAINVQSETEKVVYDDGHVQVSMRFYPHTSNALIVILKNSDSEQKNVLITLKDLEPTQGIYMAFGSPEWKTTVALTPNQPNFLTPGQGTSSALTKFEIKIQYT